HAQHDGRHEHTLLHPHPPTLPHATQVIQFSGTVEQARDVAALRGRTDLLYVPAAICAGGTSRPAWSPPDEDPLRCREPAGPAAARLRGARLPSAAPAR